MMNCQMNLDDARMTDMTGRPLPLLFRRPWWKAIWRGILHSTSCNDNRSRVKGMSVL